MSTDLQALTAPAIWIPDPQRAGTSRIAEFVTWLAEERGVPLTDPLDYQALWQWSVDHLEEFWAAVWDFFRVTAQTPAQCVLTSRTMPGARWFPGATLNYAEQALRDSRTTETALITVREDGQHTEISWDELRRQVASVAAGLRGLGVVRGDRVVGYLPNGSHAIVAFLATAALGATWSQCGQDYGAPAVIDRFAQLAPTVLFAADGYQFNGRIYDRREETARLREKLPSLTGTVLIPTLFGVAEPTDGVRSWDELAGGDANLEFEQVPFDHPLWVLFSSGTTGKPKGIVHGHGGALLEHLVVNGLHFDLGPSDTFFWYTTTNWMMWNVLASGLLTGSTVVTYDGNPTYPEPGFLWRLVEQHQVTVFGTSPGHLEVSAKAGLEPGRDLNLSHLRILGSTGATLPASAYHWVRDHVGTQIQVASISGGTDVVGLFAGSAPTTPVYAGELSARCLGVPAQSWGPTGNSQVGEVGELVITGPMPSMPLGFWNDTDGTRYRDSYFNVYPGVWRHGDWVTITTHGSVIFHGRSDSTLNRNGVRLGSAEIYEAVSGVPQIADSLILGIDEPDGGYWMPLFVVLTPGATLDQALRDAIKKAIREHASPRHVPDEIIPVTALPRTRTGKKLEVPIKRLFQGAALDQVVDPSSVDEPAALNELEKLAIARRDRLTEPHTSVHP